MAGGRHRRRASCRRREERLVAAATASSPLFSSRRCRSGGAQRSSTSTCTSLAPWRPAAAALARRGGACEEIDLCRRIPSSMATSSYTGTSTASRRPRRRAGRAPVRSARSRCNVPVISFAQPAAAMPVSMVGLPRHRAHLCFPHSGQSMRVFCWTKSLLGVGASDLLSVCTLASADEAEHGLAVADYPWPHQVIMSSYDHASIRHGHQVYQLVCAPCRSMSLISYRDLGWVAYTEEETKAIAAEIEVVDGPNDEREIFTRPGKLSDHFPQPYPNEQVSQFANGWAYPPNLILITKARHNGQNYVFVLLAGYRDPPVGV